MPQYLMGVVQHLTTAAGGGTPPTVEASNSHSASGTLSSDGVSITVTAGNLIVVTIGWGVSGSVPVTSVTGSVDGAFTQLAGAQADDNNWVNVDIWYLKSPTAGAQTITVNWSGNVTQTAVGAASFVGANLTSTFGTPGTADTTGGDSDPASVQCTAGSGALTIGVVMSDDNTNITPNGTELDEEIAIGSDTCYGQQTNAGSGTITSSWTQSGGANAWAAVNVAVNGT